MNVHLAHGIALLFLFEEGGELELAFFVCRSGDGRGCWRFGNVSE